MTEEQNGQTQGNKGWSTSRVGRAVSSSSMGPTIWPVSLLSLKHRGKRGYQPPFYEGRHSMLGLFLSVSYGTLLAQPLRLTYRHNARPPERMSHTDGRSGDV